MPTAKPANNEIEVAVLSASDVAGLTDGVNFLGGPQRAQPVLIYRQGNEVRAALNTCRHQGGMFTRSVEGATVVCARHGWTLDCSTMSYVNPPGVLEHDELRIVPLDSGGWSLLAPQRERPWDDGGARQPKPLAAGELTIRFMAHACMEVTGGLTRLFTDPWLTGPAFMRGWWLQPQPPADWLQRLAAADAIWASHAHTDHLNFPTMRLLAEENPSVPVLVPEMNPPVWRGRFEELPFTVHELKPETWYDLAQLVGSARGAHEAGEGDGDGLRLMFLRDTLCPDLDTAVLLEYKGHRILNTVDCCQPNANHLPEDVDVLLTDFASGASGFPTGFQEMFGSSVPDMVRQKRRVFAHKTVAIAQIVRPKAYIPFAGYFVEAHPDDADIRGLNLKNSPAEMCALIERQCPGTTTWSPHPGGLFDLASLSGNPPPEADGETVGPAGTWDFDGNWEFDRTWDFEPYDAEIATSLSFEPLACMAGVEHYFRWADFRHYDLVLHVVEVADHRSDSPVRSYFVDFLDLSFPVVRPTGRPYLRARVKADSMRQVMRHGSSWDDLYIGFQARWFVEPDIYHMKFWNHFARLSDRPPIEWPV